MGSKAKQIVGTLAAAGFIAGLGSAHLAWIGRDDRIGGLLLAVLWPLIGVTVALAFGAEWDRKPARRPIVFFAALGLALTVAFLVFLTATSGGLETNALVPTFVLSIVGATLYVAAISLFRPKALTRENNQEA